VKFEAAFAGMSAAKSPMIEPSYRLGLCDFGRIQMQTWKHGFSEARSREIRARDRKRFRQFVEKTSHRPIVFAIRRH